VRLTLLLPRRDAFAMKRVALALILLVTACSESNAPSTPGAVNSGPCGAPCGGDIVGKWEFSSYCGSDVYEAPLAGCAEPAIVDRSRLVGVGTEEYGDDGTYSASMTMSGVVRTTYPAGCLTSGGITYASCEQLAAAVSPTSCVVAAAGACECTIQMPPALPGTIMGTYRTDGNVLTVQLTSPSGVSQIGYCVQGDQLTQGVAMDTDAGTALAISTGSVFKRLP